MARNTLHCNELGACEICANCEEKRHPWYYCYCNNDNFGEISYPNECEEFEYDVDEDEDDEEFENDDDGEYE